MTRPTRSYAASLIAAAAILVALLWNGTALTAGSEEAGPWVAAARIAALFIGIVIGLFGNRVEFLAMLAGGVLLSGALVAFTLPVPLALTAALAGIALLNLMGRAEALLFSATVFLSVAAFYAVGETLFLAAAGQKEAEAKPGRAYRPQDLAQARSPDYPRLAANFNATAFEMPYGDLYPLSGFSLLQSTLEPRVLDYATNARGHRNIGEFRAGDLVLIGDSFGLGNGGDTQDHITTERLKREFDVPVYNASFPTDPAGYLRIHRALKKRLGQPFRTVFMFFEGNDFPCPGDSLSHLKPETDAPAFLRELETFKYLFGVSRQAIHAIWSRFGSLPVAVFDVGGQTMAFLDAYRRVSERTQACRWPDIEQGFPAIRDDIALIVFVPTKYRTYAEFAGTNESPPRVQGEFLRRFAGSLNVPFLDLTEPLRAESARLLPDRAYTFWRDDTHWNRFGMRVAAQAIARALADTGPTRPVAPVAAIGGYIDRVEAEGPDVVIVGWAADLEGRANALRVAVTDGNTEIAAARPDRERPDVAAALENSALLRSGFVLRVPVEALTGRPGLRFLAVLPGSRTARLTVSPQAAERFETLGIVGARTNPGDRP